MSLRRHVLQVVALVTAVALVFGAFAGSAGAKKVSKSQKAKIRAELRKQVKKNPGVVKRRAFLRKAALVNFKLPVTIRLRTPCNPASNAGAVGATQIPGGYIATPLNCVNQGTALNQLRAPTASVNLGPSLGRVRSASGALNAVVEFNDTYDGGALGNVNLKIIGGKNLTTSSVPLLWNSDITNPNTRGDANFAKASIPAYGSPFPAFAAAHSRVWLYLTNNGRRVGYAPNTAFGEANYRALFYDSGFNFGLGVNGGVPGYPVYATGGGAPNGVYLGINKDLGVESPTALKNGSVTMGTTITSARLNPFPWRSTRRPWAPALQVALLPRTEALLTPCCVPARCPWASLRVVPRWTSAPGIRYGGQHDADDQPDDGYRARRTSRSATPVVGQPVRQHPGQEQGINVTVNLATKINSIVRIMDQDIFKSPGLLPVSRGAAGLFNCRRSSLIARSSS